MASRKFHPFMITVNLLILVSMAVVPLHATALVPVTGDWSTAAPSVGAATTPSLAMFIEQVQNGSGRQITGVFVDRLFSFPVVQQPSGQPAYVSPNDNLLTQFQFASSYGSLGFLAHNSLAGIRFTNIENGDLISVVYGDGHFLQYQVTQIRKFQALQPNNPYSSFVDLSDNRRMTVEDVFYQTYGVRDQLILQTCIASEGLDSWGRLFVIAVPYTPVASTISIPLPRVVAKISFARVHMTIE